MGKRVHILSVVRFLLYLFEKFLAIIYVGLSVVSILQVPIIDVLPWDENRLFLFAKFDSVF